MMNLSISQDTPQTLTKNASRDTEEELLMPQIQIPEVELLQPEVPEVNCDPEPELLRSTYCKAWSELSRYHKLANDLYRGVLEYEKLCGREYEVLWKDGRYVRNG